MNNMNKIDMLNVPLWLWLLCFCGFISGICLILKGWRKHKEEPEVFQIWHIFGSESNRNHGINWMIEGLVVFVAGLWFLYFILFLYRG